MMPAYLRPRARRFIWLPVALVTVILMACGGSGAVGDSPFPVEVTSQRVVIGEQVYATNCTVCHGEIGSAPTLPGAPSHAEDGHTWHHADRNLFGWILDRPPLARVMPPFRGTLSDEEVFSVIAYMKSEWPADIQSRQNQLSRLIEQQILEDAGG